jgi:hypothetical protein
MLSSGVVLDNRKKGYDKYKRELKRRTYCEEANKQLQNFY